MLIQHAPVNDDSLPQWLAGMLGIETRRTMTRGMLNPEEPDSVAVLKDMIQAATRRYGEQSERRVCFTVPAAPLGANDRLTYHEATVKQILTASGFHAPPVPAGLATSIAGFSARAQAAERAIAGLCAGPAGHLGGRAQGLGA